MFLIRSRLEPEKNVGCSLTSWVMPNCSAVAVSGAVLVVYLVGIVAFGLWAGRGNRKIDDFFLAGREMRWWTVGRRPR